MGVYEGRGQLAKSFNHLQLQWREVKMGWNDAASKYVETTFIDPLGDDLRSAAGAMEHMAQVLIQVRHDCQ